MRIQESDMVFGEFDESDCCYIDREGGYYKTKLSGYGIKSVDFVLHHENRNKLLFVEARKSIAGADSLHRCLDSEIWRFDVKVFDESFAKEEGLVVKGGATL